MLRRAVLALSVALLYAGAFAACSDPPAKPGAAIPGSTPSGGGSGGGGGSGADSGLDADSAATDGGACNDVDNKGVLVDRVAVLGDPPVAMGGTIATGEYDLTSYTVYVGATGVSGPTGITAKASVRVGASAFDEALELGGTGKTATTSTVSSKYTASGATLAMTELCPSAGVGRQVQFTSTDTSLTLTDLTSKEAFTFVKR